MLLTQNSPTIMNSFCSSPHTYKEEIQKSKENRIKKLGGIEEGKKMKYSANEEIQKKRNQSKEYCHKRSKNNFKPLFSSPGTDALERVCTELNTHMIKERRASVVADVSDKIHLLQLMRLDSYMIQRGNDIRLIACRVVRQLI